MEIKFTSKNIENFWNKVDKEKSEIFYNGERCWEWIGCLAWDGYGVFGVDYSHQIALQTFTLSRKSLKRNFRLSCSVDYEYILAQYYLFVKHF